MNGKRRKYDTGLLKYGFTDFMVNSQVVSQCVI